MNLRISDRLLLGLDISAQMRAYPSAKLFYWTPVGYSRHKYRDLIGRLQRLNLIQRTVLAGAVNFRLTANGRQRLFLNFPALALTGKTWDGFWRVVMFDIPEAKRKERDGLRRRLMKLGFGRLQDSTYLSAYDWDEIVFGSPVLFLEAKQKHLGDPKKLADKIWHLEKIANGYRQVIDRLTTRFGIKDAKKRDEFLRKTNQEFLAVFLTDPVLPPELLPADWPAAKCRKFLLQAGVVKE